MQINNHPAYVALNGIDIDGHLVRVKDISERAEDEVETITGILEPANGDAYIPFTITARAAQYTNQTMIEDIQRAFINAVENGIPEVGPLDYAL
jgi:hypothetical protein